MNIVELKKGIYHVGVTDWNVRNFHGYSTHKGTTYNAYLILDDKITLIDTVKKEFAGELLEQISQIIDPAKIDYLVSNHVEMDHSGAIPEVMKIATHATILTSAPNGIKGLEAHYGTSLPYQVVKSGEEISIGKRTLTFVATPMVHWPDNMVTYCKEEKILFSNDAFGEHYATNQKIDEKENIEILLQEAQKYYANIVMPYGMQTRKALEIVKGLELEMIAPSHGVVWKKYIDRILKQYEYFSNDISEKTAVIVYDSMWHSTEKMAFAILEAFSKQGIKAKLYDLKVSDNSDIITEILKAKYVAVGSPTLNNQMLPTVAGFLTYMKGLAPKDKVGFAFGSYGWGGQSIGLVNTELENAKFRILVPPIRIQYIPSKEQLKEIEKQIEEALTKEER